MKNLQTYTEFITEKHQREDLITKTRYNQKPAVQPDDTKDAHHQPDMHTFDLADLKDKIEKSIDDVEKDLSTKKQTMKANKDLAAGDFVIHKHKQSLGIGNIQKIHPNKTHADIHFVDGLKSSLADDQAQDEYDLHTMEIKHLIPVIGTQS